MPSLDEIAEQQRLLAQHRQRLAAALHQIARFGGRLYAPPQLIAEAEDSRAVIAGCQATLRGWGVPPDEWPDDSDPAA